MTRPIEDATVSLPGDGERLRCGGCGNLTRFDVLRLATINEYWHQALSGVANVEESETVEQRLVSITCRWCGRTDAIEVVPRPDTGQQ
jgi:hypothetical protein